MTVVPDDLGGAVPGPMALEVARLEEDAERRYQDYRRRQVAALPSILPREAIRPLYARAREWRRASGLETGKDPLDTLLLFLQQILPLPPLEVWMSDRHGNPGAHLRDEYESPQAQSRPTPPVTVESRGMDLGGRRFRAALHLFRRDEAWRGFITFHPVDGGEVLRTADIFREDDPEEIRSRFLGYENHTLQAFLRSVFPG